MFPQETILFNEVRKGKNYFQFTASLCHSALLHFIKEKYPKACKRQAMTPGDKEGLQRMLLPMYALILWDRGASCTNLSTENVKQGWKLWLS